MAIPDRLDTKALLILTLLAAVGVLGGAWFSQLVGGLIPCELCLAERWPWYIALVLSALLLALRSASGGVARAAKLFLALLFLASTALAAYHVGVEQHWIEGPTACTAASTKGLSLDQLRARILATPVVRCDEVQWSLFGISLAGWNGIASLGLALLALLARPAPSRLGSHKSTFS